jgi:hypothetical protein
LVNPSNCEESLHAPKAMAIVAVAIKFAFFI